MVRFRKKFCIGFTALFEYCEHVIYYVSERFQREHTPTSLLTNGMLFKCIKEIKPAVPPTVSVAVDILYSTLDSLCF